MPRGLGFRDCWGSLGGVTGLQTVCSLVPLSSPEVGFLRFLFLVSTFDWKNNPLIVNLNNELTGKWEDWGQTAGRTTLLDCRVGLARVSLSIGEVFFLLLHPRYLSLTLTALGWGIIRRKRPRSSLQGALRP